MGFKTEVDKMREKAKLDSYSEQCRTCPYHEFCLKPIMTREEATNNIRDLINNTNNDLEAAMVGTFAPLVFGNEHRKLWACPVFVERIRNDGKFGRFIKAVMTGKVQYQEEEEDESEDQDTTER